MFFRLTNTKQTSVVGYTDWRTCCSRSFPGLYLGKDGKCISIGCSRPAPRSPGTSFFQSVSIKLLKKYRRWFHFRRTVCGECDSTFETRDLLERTWVWNLTKLLFKSEECGTTFKPKRIFSDSNFTGLQKDCLMKEWLQLMWKNFCRKLQN